MAIGYYNNFYDKKVAYLQPLNSSDRDEVVKWLYDSHLIEWWITRLSRATLDNDDVADKVQDIYEMVLSVPQEKWDSLYDDGACLISAYVVGLIKRQLISDKSYIYKKYNKYNSTFFTQDETFWAML